jgi:cephalosporin-C deacetylase-like acetyl esterase
MSVLVMAVVLAAPADDLAAVLRDKAAVWTHADPSGTVPSPLREKMRQANLHDSKAWGAIADRAGWEKHRDVRLAALRRSLGTFPEPPGDLKLRVRKTITGEGYRIDNITFESRPGLLVTANLYRPEKPGTAMPGLLLIHSHHAPKTQGELQDMGVMWARAGCLVLVMDMPGHGERRDHPFRTKEDYPKPFRPDRQDYFFRYNLAIALQTMGDSLMGWMVWDVQRGIDLLLSRPGIDAKKIIVLGAVAGGGDPAAVAAALDRRIAAAAPFNFGGPQPETRYPLGADSETRFNYAGSGSWESTRNLAWSAKEGFLPWLIVGAIAPRRHLYGHEFAWDQKRDPVWKRLEKIHAWHDHPDHLAFVHGSGRVTGRPPEATHCTNIGPVHRKGIHEALKKWFGIQAKEVKERHASEDLFCLGKDERPRLIHQVAADEGLARAEAARKRLGTLTPAGQRKELRAAWGKLLGDVEPARVVQQVSQTVASPIAGVQVEKIGLRGEDWVWALLLRPASKGRLPLVVAFGQGGTQGFLAHRAAEVAELLRGGSAVALVSLGGPSTQKPGTDRGRRSSATQQASTSLMLGQPLLGARLAELRQVLAVLRKHPQIDPKQIGLWGDSFAAVNAPGESDKVPLELAQPAQAEPMGGILALLCPLFEEGIVSVRARGGLVSYQSLLSSPFCHIPYDVVVPGALTAGDLADVAGALAPLPVRLEGLVDGRNRAVPARERRQAYQVALEAYRAAKAAEKLQLP